MCYSIFLSTTSDQNLGDLPSELFRFERDSEAESGPIASLLAHPHRWFLTGQYGGCSCHFRHLVRGNKMEFGPPEDWCPEDNDDIESTVAVYQALSKLVEDGHEVDVLDLWSDTSPTETETIEVNLSQVPPDAFRFFDGHRFVLTP